MATTAARRRHRRLHNLRRLDQQWRHVVPLRRPVRRGARPRWAGRVAKSIRRTQGQAVHCLVHRNAAGQVELGRQPGRHYIWEAARRSVQSHLRGPVQCCCCQQAQQDQLDDFVSIDRKDQTKSCRTAARQLPGAFPSSRNTGLLSFSDYMPVLASKDILVKGNKLCRK